ncbi:hypothetical protein ACFVWL_01630 [Microbacterium sp. NPDC058269]|uniref:hypothetical protein n=1 Tax=Microbacterium sp. NPDC058269 TaxID=3346414 RepID=UPI0036DABAB5
MTAESFDLYLVFPPTRERAKSPLWVAAARADGRMYVYIANTGRFHRNDALAEDFLVDQELVYHRATEAQARRAIADRVGLVTGISRLARYANDVDALALDDVLGP